MTTTNRTVAGLNLIYLWHRMDLYAEAMDRLLAWVGAGSIRPWPGRAFPFDAVADAHRFLHSRESTGKVLLTVER